MRPWATTEAAQWAEKPAAARSFLPVVFIFVNRAAFPRGAAVGRASWTEVSHCTLFDVSLPHSLPLSLPLDPGDIPHA